MASGDVDSVRQPDTVLTDALYMDALGVTHLGQELEILERRAVVGGISREVRTFTAAPFVFTSIESAIRYDRRYRDDDVTYVLARCADGYSVDQVRDSIARYVPHVEALTSHEFAVRTMKYWMLETGVGITVVVTAVLGLIVGAFVMSQTLFAITQDYLPNYSTLVALGFSRARLGIVILAQSLILGGGGIALGSLLFSAAIDFSRTTPIPVETTPTVFAGLVAISLAQLRTRVVHLDPVDPANRPGDGPSSLTMSVMLACYGISKNYDVGLYAERVLDDVSLSLRRGQACALIGPSGSGKTTLLSILGCLLSPTSGELRIDGLPVNHGSGRSLAEVRRTRIGFVFQQAQLLPFLTMRENLQIVGRNAGLSEALMNVRIDELAACLDIQRLLGKKPGLASGGQRQRVAIARALIHRPPIILADEPTAALDWVNGEVVIRLLTDQAKAEERSC